MCDPVTLGLVGGGMAASAVGTGISSKENADYQKGAYKAATGAANAERMRQHGYQGQASDIMGQTLATAAPTQAREQAIVADRTGSLTHSMPTEAAYDPGSSAPGVVGNMMAQALGNAVASTRSQAEAGARLGAPGEMLAGSGRAINSGASRMGDVGSFSRGSLALLPGEQQSAVNRVKRPSGFGDLLAGFGNLATFGGMAGMGAGMGGAAAARPGSANAGIGTAMRTTAGRNMLYG